MGNPDIVHVGAHLYHAAESCGCGVALLNSEDAFQGPALIAKLNWWIRGRRPTRLRAFSANVLRACLEFRPDWLLSTGIAPIAEEALQSIGALGIRRMNYLTDDPCNPHHRAPWFMRALRHYDQVFSPRRANLEDLRKLGCSDVSYLPFAYAPEVHFADPPASEEETARFSADVVFAGGADADRLRHVTSLIREGFHVALYGAYWHRHSETRRFALGHADPYTLRKAIGGSKVALCLVRRANRDGHSMRTFEVAATGACMLTEDSEEHREILGPDGEAVIYFRTVPEMLQKLHWLVQRPDERRRLSVAVRSRVTNGQNTYAHRLGAMLDSIVDSRPMAC